MGLFAVFEKPKHIMYMFVQFMLYFYLVPLVITTKKCSVTILFFFFSSSQNKSMGTFIEDPVMATQYFPEFIDVNGWSVSFNTFKEYIIIY